MFRLISYISLSTSTHWFEEHNSLFYFHFILHFFFLLKSSHKCASHCEYMVCWFSVIFALLYGFLGNFPFFHISSIYMIDDRGLAYWNLKKNSFEFSTESSRIRWMCFHGDFVWMSNFRSTVFQIESFMTKNKNPEYKI